MSEERIAIKMQFISQQGTYYDEVYYIVCALWIPFYNYDDFSFLCSLFVCLGKGSTASFY